jgi:hypothetical protein
VMAMMGSFFLGRGELIYLRSNFKLAIRHPSLSKDQFSGL